MNNNYFRKISALILCIIFTSTNTAYPLPANPTIVEGSADIVVSSDNSTMNINAADNTVLNFDSFDINHGESVIVNLPSVNSEILNRVMGDSASNIAGSLSCNGIFILVNTAGIYVASTAQIEASGLVLSTLDITNQDFLTGNHLFQKLSEEQLSMLLVNEGNITLQDGGFGVLIAGAIENGGTIIAPLGKIALATGDAIKLDISNGGLISVAIDEEVASTIYDSLGNPITDQIHNTGILEAEGGVVMLKAESIDDIFVSAINHDGYIKATRFQEVNGEVIFAVDGDVSIAGTIDASSVKILSDRNLEVTGTIASENDIILTADFDEDDIGQFRQTGGIITPGDLGSIYINGINFGKGLNLSGLPLYFIPNMGQINNEEVEFYVRLGNSIYYFTPSGMYLMLQDGSVEGSYCFIPVGLNFLEANEKIDIESAIITGSIYNYFIGEGSYTDIPSYYQIMYDNLYNGIDLVYTSRDGNLESEFLVRPGSNYEDIAVKFDNIESLSVDAEGNLIIFTQAGELMETHPYVYQDIDGQRHEIEAEYTILSDDTYGFAITGAYDLAHQLVIDPELTYSTFLGGSGSDTAKSIAVDSSGCAYITGATSSSQLTFPLKNPYQDEPGGAGEVFVSKIDPSQSGSNSLIYSTYIGGGGSDSGWGIAVDSSGNAYITGIAGNHITEFFPTTGGAYDQVQNGGGDAFVAKLSADGDDLLYSTFIGGSGNDYGYGIALDSANDVYITGYTEDDVTDFPVVGAYQGAHEGDDDVFVAKLNLGSNGVNDLKYSTFLGGDERDRGYAIAVDTSGYAYVTGYTIDAAVTDFPFKDGYNTHNGGLDVFVAKLGPGQTGADSLVYSTFLGGDDTEAGYGIAVDSSGNVYVTGETNDNGSGIDFPTTAEAYSESNSGGIDAFITVLNAQGDGLLYSTFFGDTTNDFGRSIGVDSQGNVFVTGDVTGALDTFPTTDDAYDKTANGWADIFVAKLNPGGNDANDLVYSTLLGGSKTDQYPDLAIDSEGNVYVTGLTEDDITEFPTTENAYAQDSGGGYDAFVLKFTFASEDEDSSNDAPEDDVEKATTINDPLETPGTGTDGSENGEPDIDLGEDADDDGEAGGNEGVDGDSADYDSETGDDGEEAGDDSGDGGKDKKDKEKKDKKKDKKEKKEHRIVNTGDAVEGGVDKFDVEYNERPGAEYEKGYAHGKFRTVIMVYKGQIVGAPYDAEGPKYDQGTVINAGQSKSSVIEF